MEIVKIAAVCLVAAVFAKVIQSSNRDLSALISISAVIFSAFIIIGAVSEVVSGISGIAASAGIGKAYISLAFKALGICYISELCSSVCRDCSETALAGVLDISGRIAVALLALPLLREFIELIVKILEI